MKAHFTVALLIASCGTCASQQPWAANLIDLLTYDREAAMGFSQGCRKPPHFDEAEKILSGLSVRDLEGEIDVIERRGYAGEVAQWIWLEYARVKGAGAFQRLREIEQNPAFGSDQQFGDDSVRRELDSALALSLGLTSYVSSSPDDHLAAHVRYICSPPEGHRDALDDFLRAFERDDELSFKRSLGSDAYIALGSLLKGTQWNQLWAAMLRDKRPGDFAIGYELVSTRLDTTFSVRFKSSSGADCGSYQVKFIPTARGISSAPFLVDNSDLGGLLQVIATCLVKN